jgi:hypothetical protein
MEDQKIEKRKSFFRPFRTQRNQGTNFERRQGKIDDKCIEKQENRILKVKDVAARAGRVSGLVSVFGCVLARKAFGFARSQVRNQPSPSLRARLKRMQIRFLPDNSMENNMPNANTMVAT